jgi:hypothetical protein
VKVTCYDPGYQPLLGPDRAAYDGVICTDVLEHITEEDIPWVLDKLFSHARLFVYAVAACYPARKQLPDGQNAHCTLQEPDWWREQMEAAARRVPRREVAALRTREGPARQERPGLPRLSAAPLQPPACTVDSC